MEPMLLKPVGKDYLWGGTRLKTEYGKHLGMETLAETWECSIHPDGPSLVVNGEFEGITLDKVLEDHPEYMGSKVGEGSGLPILIKFIDAAKDLSVQVHPDDEYARVHEGQNGKTEMWYVVDAQPQSELICGFAHDVTREQLRNAVSTGNLMKHLQKVKVHKGDVFFMPAGTIHAIGAGTLLVEIQENSNVTYRVYDYERIDKAGQKRALHLDKALEVLDKNAIDVMRQKPRMVQYHPGCSRELLCRCQYFEAEKIQLVREYTFLVSENSFQVLLCLEGNGFVKTENDAQKPLGFTKGDCIFLPADLGNCHVSGCATLLKVRC